MKSLISPLVTSRSTLATILTMAVIVLVSCDKETITKLDLTKSLEEKTLTEDEVKSLVLLKEDHEIPFSQIQQEVEQVSNEIRERTNDGRTSSVLIPQYTRIMKNIPEENGRINQDTSTIAYLVNFINEQEEPKGHAIISADERVPGVLSMSAYGNIEDTVTTPGFGGFLVNLDAYIQNEAAIFDQYYDSILTIALNKLSENLPDSSDSTKQSPNGRIQPGDGTYTIYTYYTYGSWSDAVRVGRLTSTDWHQHLPYNRDIDLWCDTEPAVAGCGAVAAAQIMAFYHLPDSHADVTYDWAGLTQNSELSNDPNVTPVRLQNQIAHLMDHAGWHLNTIYTCQEGGTSITDLFVDKLWDAFNYQFEGLTVVDYNTSAVRDEILANRPVMMQGMDTKTTIWVPITALLLRPITIYTGGHIWVTDGYRRRQRTKTTTIEIIDQNGYLVSRSSSTSQEFLDMFHHNWGWQGAADTGWYVAGAFDPRNGADITSNNRISSEGQEWNYQYRVKYLPGLRPQ